MNKYIKVGNELQRDLLTSALIISSRIIELDELLDGGFYSGELTCFQSFNDNLYTKLTLNTMALVALIEKKEVIYIASSQSLETTTLLKIMKNHSSNKKSQYSTFTNFLTNSQSNNIVSNNLNFINIIETKDQTDNLKSCAEDANNLHGSQSFVLIQNSCNELTKNITNNNLNIDLSDTPYNQFKNPENNFNNGINTIELNKNLKKSTANKFPTNSLTDKLTKNGNHTVNLASVCIDNENQVEIANALNRIKVLHMYCIYELIHTLTSVSYELKENCGIKLLIIDQLDLLFLQLLGALKACELTGILSKILQLLKRMAYEHNIAVMLVSFSDKTLKKHLHSDIFKLQVQNYVAIQCSDKLLFNKSNNENIPCQTKNHPDSFIYLSLEKSLRLPEMIKKIHFESFI